MFSLAMKGPAIRAAAHDLRVDHEAVGDVEHDVQDGVGGEEALSHGNALAGAVVQRALEPLRAGGSC